LIAIEELNILTIITATDSYMTSDFVLSSNAFSVDQAFEGTAADLFTDPANGDFTLKTYILSGDPRWYPVAE